MLVKDTEMLLIGKAPVHISKEDLLDYFLYVFEFSWSSPIFEEKKWILDVEFEERAKALYPEYQSFSKEKIWWMYVLLALQSITEHQDLKYGKTTIDTLLNRLPSLSEESLEKYVNEIQHAFYDEIPDIILVRPLEMKVLQNSTLESDQYLPFFVDNKDRFVKVFEKHLRQKDVNKEHLHRFTLGNPKKFRKFTSFWEGYYEIFINYFVALYDFRMPFDEQEKEDEMALIEEMILLFVIGSITNKSIMDDLTDDLLVIFDGFVEECGKRDS